MPTFIPGYEAVLTINSDNVTAISSSATVTENRNVVTKNHFGSPYSEQIAGKRSASVSASGNLSAEQAYALRDSFDTGDVTATVQWGTASGDTDAGLHSLDVILTSLEWAINADGDATWSVQGVSSGVVSYTPAAGASA